MTTFASMLKDWMDPEKIKARHREEMLRLFWESYQTHGNGD